MGLRPKRRIQLNGLRIAHEKQDSLEILKKRLETDADLDLLLELKGEDLRTLVACVRVRVV